MEYKYIDIHSHLNLPDFKEDWEDVAAKLAAEEIATIIVGVDQATSASAVAMADQKPNLYACIGQHPVDNVAEEFDADFYRNLATDPKVVAIGECGLDYFRLKVGSEEMIARQKAMFRSHVELSLASNLPLMIHARPRKGTMDAYEDVLAILSEYASNTNLRGNVHFFVGNVTIAQCFIELGFTMSFTGVLTFSSDYDEVIRYLPIENIIAETDAPFVAPVPYRGQRCEPGHVRQTVARIAELKGTGLEDTRKAIISNIQRVFGI